MKEELTGSVSSPPAPPPSPTLEVDMPEDNDDKRAEGTEQAKEPSGKQGPQHLSEPAKDLSGEEKQSDGD